MFERTDLSNNDEKNTVIDRKCFSKYAAFVVKVVFDTQKIFPTSYTILFIIIYRFFTGEYISTLNINGKHICKYNIFKE